MSENYKKLYEDKINAERKRQKVWRERQIKSGKKIFNLYLSKKAQDIIGNVRKEEGLTIAEIVEDALVFRYVTNNSLRNVDGTSSIVTEQHPTNVASNGISARIKELVEKHGNQWQKIAEIMNEEGFTNKNGDPLSKHAIQKRAGAIKNGGWTN